MFAKKIGEKAINGYEFLVEESWTQFKFVNEIVVEVGDISIDWNWISFNGTAQENQDTENELDDAHRHENNIDTISLRCLHFQTLYISVTRNVLAKCRKDNQC